MTAALGTLTDDELAAIEQRWAQATQGRWVPETCNEFPEDPDCGVMVELSRGRWGWICDIASVQGAGKQREYDAIALAAAPSDVAALVAEVRRLRALVGARHG